MKKFKEETAKGIMIGVVMTSIMFTSIPTMAMSARKTIEVVYSNIKLVVDGQEVTPRDGNGNIVEPFVYNGTTYLPLRACVNAISGGAKEVAWDANSSTIYIGEYNTEELSKTVKMNTLKPISGNAFATYTFTNRQMDIKSDNANPCYGKFLLGGKYKTFNAMLLGVDTENGSTEENTIIFTDIDTGKELASYTVKTFEEPIAISVDVTGVDKFRISTQHSYACYLYDATLTLY